MQNIIKKLKNFLMDYEERCKYEDITINDLQMIKSLAKTICYLEDMDDYDDKDYMIDLKSWVAKFQNEDGTYGPHWSIEDTTSVANSNGVTFTNISTEDWYTALNMAYSDYCQIAKKFNVDNVAFYVDLAKQFLWDKDTKMGHNKLVEYYEHIAK